MLLETWSSVLARSFQDVWLKVAWVVPNLVVSIIIFIVGWLVGSLLGKLVMHAVRSLKVDRALQSAGVDELVEKAGFRLDAGKFLGGLVKWFLVLVFLVAALDVLGLSQVNMFLQEVVLGYLPRVIVAVLVLLLAAVIAELLKKVVVGSARAAGVRHAHFLGSIAHWAIWIFAILVALSQLGIAEQFAQTLFTGVIAMLALAGGLAFGLGGRDHAAQFLDRLRSDMSGK